MRRAAVIDIGSNSIKGLVATPGPGSGLVAVAHQTEDARISRGISQAEPRLTEEGMQRGLEAVATLLATIREHSPDSLDIVATSAVRDARNGADFATRVAELAGQPLRILGGLEEAELIGRGMRCDPALAGATDFYVFDLGGGSLECLQFIAAKLHQAVSLPLGCVRLCERFVSDPAQPLPTPEARAIRQHVDTILRERFDFSARTLPAVFAGGTMTTIRAMLAESVGVEIDDIPARIDLATVEAALDRLAAMTLAERETVPGLSSRRADVMPTALVTIVALAEVGGFSAFQHSLYNLRWGVAATALESFR